RVGSERTAEELGRAFPGTRVRQSGSGPGVLEEVPAEPAIIVATPGAEPVAEGGYAAALLLDAAVWTGRWGLHAGEDAVRRWFEAAALVRPAGEDGQVLLVGDGAPVPTQALVRWDPAWFAERELAERRELRLPPAVRVATVTGTREAVDALVGRLELPEGAEVLGPVAVSPRALGPGAELGDGLEAPVRVLLRVGYAGGARLAAELRASLAVRSARAWRRARGRRPARHRLRRTCGRRLSALRRAARPPRASRAAPRRISPRGTVRRPTSTAGPRAPGDGTSRADAACSTRPPRC